MGKANGFSVAKYHQTKCRYSLLVTVLGLCAIPVFAADIDFNAGAKIYKDACAKCHSIAKPMTHKKGPSLLGIVGRRSSGLDGYKYSDAMRVANLTWTSEKLDSFLINPKAVVPNNKMKFKGLANAEDRANVLEFLLLQQ